MAAENLSSVNAALSQTFFPDLHRQWNRSAIIAGLIAASASAGQGKNVAFDVEFSGNTAATVAEGSDVQASEFASDVNVPAVLPWAHYRSSFQISETELDAAASSIGVPAALMDLFGDRVMGAGAKIARAINTDMISGTGVDGSGNPTIIGITSGALETTGAYGGLSRATYSEWQGNVLKNGGTARPLTVDLLEQMDQNIFIASNEMYTDVLASPGVFRKYRGLFETIRRVSGDGGTPNAGTLGAGDVFFKGVPVRRDPNMPTGTLAFVNRNRLRAKWLPRVLNPNDAVLARMMGIVGGNGGGADAKQDVTGIPMRVAVLAKTGDSIKVSVKVTLAMCATRPNAMGYIGDISEV